MKIYTFINFEISDFKHNIIFNFMQGFKFFKSKFKVKSTFIKKLF